METSITPAVHTLPKHKLSCPNPDPKEYGEECGDNPDPPEPPKPPEPPICGNKIVEEFSTEECDCGATHEECDDPCCYPATITDQDRLLNETAKGCRRHNSGSCQNPYQAAYQYGIIIPLVVFILGILLLAIILCIDWRYGKRLCYGHILERPQAIHCEDESQKLRRIQRGNIM